jgi:hypothetical protein
MSRARSFATLLVLLALLGGVVALRQFGVERMERLFAGLSGEPGAGGLDARQESAALAEARRLPTVARIDALLGLVDQGSLLAAAEVETWLVAGYAPGDLSPAQCARLEAIALRSPGVRTRRAAAGLLLAEQGAAPGVAEAEASPEALRARIRALGLQGLRAELAEADEAWLRSACGPGQPALLREEAWRAWAAARGPASLDPLLESLASSSQDPEVVLAALFDLAACWPESRDRAIPACIELLRGPARNRSAALDYLRQVTDRDLGEDPEAWAAWWEEARALLRRFDR